MSPELISYITEYGYFAIFGLVFLQEIGVPNPVPNEFVLLFSGYLTSIGTLSFPLVILTVVAADFIGTAVLYVIFYFFGKHILAHKPKWIPLSNEKIEKMIRKISGRGKLEIYLGRLIPYLRSYISIAAGILQTRPKTYLIAVLASAATWSGGYVIIGNRMGSYWETFIGKVGNFQNFLFLLVLLPVFVFCIKYLFRKYKERKIKKEKPLQT
jgi:membrane protein DedA with SNARE-associated domain